MTDQLDPHEVTTDRPQVKEPVRARVTRVIAELISVADELTTTLELTDIDSAIMYLRHLDRRLMSRFGVILKEE